MPGDRQGCPGRPQYQPLEYQDQAALSAEFAEPVLAVGYARAGAPAPQRRGNPHDREEWRARRLSARHAGQSPVARDPPPQEAHPDRRRPPGGVTPSAPIARRPWRRPRTALIPRRRAARHDERRPYRRITFRKIEFQPDPGPRGIASTNARLNGVPVPALCYIPLQLYGPESDSRHTVTTFYGPE